MRIRLLCLNSFPGLKVTNIWKVIISLDTKYIWGLHLIHVVRRSVCRYFLWTLILRKHWLEFHETSQQWWIPSLVVHSVILFRFGNYRPSNGTLKYLPSNFYSYFLWTLFLGNNWSAFHETSQQWWIPSLIVHAVILFWFNYSWRSYGTLKYLPLNFYRRFLLTLFLASHWS